MEKTIKINKIDCIPYVTAIEAVKNYIIIHGFANNDFGIKIHLDKGYVHVQCRTTPKSHIFDVWLAV